MGGTELFPLSTLIVLSCSKSEMPERDNQGIFALLGESMKLIATELGADVPSDPDPDELVSRAGCISTPALTELFPLCELLLLPLRLRIRLERGLSAKL